MKYTILGFQQKKLIEEGLKADDALILRTIKDMYSSASMEFKIIEDKTYMWVNYTYLHAQIPIIGTKRTITNKIKNYVEKELIARRLLHERKGQKGNFAYIRPTKKLDRLQDYDPYEIFSQGLGKDFSRDRKNFRNKDSSIIDSSIKDSSSSTTGAELLFDKEIKELGELYQKCGFRWSGLTPDWLADIKNRYGIEWCKNALIVAEKKNKRNKRYVEGILENWDNSGGMNLGGKKDESTSKSGNSSIKIDKSKFLYNGD